MTKQHKYLMTEATRKLAGDIAALLFHAPYSDLPNTQKISVADHVWNMGLSYQSRALKDELGVSHG